MKNDYKSKKYPTGGDAASQVVNEFLQEFIVVYSIGVWVILKSWFNRKFWWSILLSLLSIAVIYWLSINKYLFQMALIDDPSLRNSQYFRYFYNQPISFHLLSTFLVTGSPIICFIGAIARSTRVKYQKAFSLIGLTNKVGDTPKLIYKNKKRNGRQDYVFDYNGVSVDEFKAKQPHLESFFESNIEAIKYGTSKKHIILTLCDKPFPEKVSYSDLAASMVLPKYNFYLGRTSEGIVSQSVTELPHMLIAGTTGSGKSVFFKQALLGLLESSPFLQMYLIDLKSGLEMIDFISCPNVKVIKTMEEAVQLLRLANKEMKRRFDYLEKSHRKQINPGPDKMDRMVVAIDEASVLYMNRPRTDPEYHLAIEARTLADNIAKLSRAAGIHLLFATQKLDRQVIPTSVSENISGRMAFRANSLQGSLVVLGNKAAAEIPEVPGRGVWSFGTKQFTIQAPYVDEKTIQARCKKISLAFKNGQRSMLSPMLGTGIKTKKKKTQSKLYGAMEVMSDNNRS